MFPRYHPVSFPLAYRILQPADLLYRIISRKAEKARKERQGKINLILGRSNTYCTLYSTLIPPQNWSDTIVKDWHEKPDH